jgi:DNA-binding SARP family transcriptional activator
VAATLHIRLLGDFSLSYGDHPITGVQSPRLQSLLAYLVLHRGAPQSRRHIAYVFWPDASESQARNNLRQFLYELRQRLPDAEKFLDTDASTVTWKAHNDEILKVDVAQFEHALAESSVAEQRGDVVAVCARLQAAVALYRGDLLPGCYDDWIAGPRDQLRARCVDALRRLARLLEKRRAYGAAIPYAQRMIEFDPLDESAYVDLMRLHALNSDKGAVRRIYEQCVEILRRELGMEPSTTTREWYERVRDAQLSDLQEQHDVNLSTPPFVGRQHEWEQLRRSWDRTNAGESHLLLISGEAGIGKTRLAEQLLTWANQQGFANARSRSYAAEGQLTLAPVTEWLRSDSIRQSLTKVADVWLTEVARLLPELLVERPDLPRPEPITEFGECQRFFEALARAVSAAPQPLLLLIDDLQWCDQETLEWLHFLLRFDADKRVLVLGTMRVEDVLPLHPVMQWLIHLRHAGVITELPLRPLNAIETARLGALITKHPLDDESAAQLFHETEGNPLYVVEMARAGLNQEAAHASNARGSSALHDVRVVADLPPRMYAVIAGRLAQLSPAAYELAGLAAAVGRAFTVELLAQARGNDTDSVITALDELWQRRIVRAIATEPRGNTLSFAGGRGVYSDANSYDFSHDKIRDVAYAELSPIKRRHWHLRIARSLEVLFATDLDAVTRQLVSHYEHAGEAEKAVPLYQRAAEVAQQMYANDEAIAILQHGLALLGDLPSDPHHEEQRLSLLELLSLALVATRGYGAPEVLDTLSRAQRLNEQLGKPPDPLILRALAIANLNFSNVQQSRVFGEQLLQLARRQHDPVLVVEGHYVLGVTLFWASAFAPSRTHLEQALVHYDPTQSQAHIIRHSQDPKAVCLCRLAFGLWCLGYPDQAVAVQGDSVTYAQQLGHPFSLAYVMTWNAMLSWALGNAEAARESCELVMTLSQEYKLGLWPSWARVLRGWARGATGDPETGLAEIRHGDELMRQAGAVFLQPFVSMLLAEQFAAMGRLEQGVKLLRQELSSDQIGQRWCDAELYRLYGDLLMRSGNPFDEVEAAYRRAIVIAQEQQSKMFELRATTRLARLWQGRGGTTEARRLLTRLYGWFSEGFETPDLRGAQALLDLVAR